MKKNKLSIQVIVASSIVGLLVVAVGIFLYLYSLPININIPTPQMPQPNAYDYYVSAAGQEVYSRQCNEAISPPPYSKPTPSGMTGLPGMPAMPGFPPMAPPKTPLKRPKGIPELGTLKRPYTLDEKKALIRANESVFRTLREGFKYECLAPPKRSAWDPHFDDGAKFRQLARLLSFKIKVHNESGEYDQAIQTVLDGIELGSDTSKGSAIIGYLVSSAIYSIVRQDASSIVDKLDSEQARAAAARLEDIEATAVSFEDILREDKYTSLSYILESSSYASISEAFAAYRRSRNDFFDNLRFNIGKKGILRRYELDWDNAIKSATKPYVEYVKSPMPNCGESMKDTKDLLPAFRYIYEYDRYDNDTLLLRLALRAYKIEKGKYPAKLDVLIPGYLKKLPRDPFASSGEYRFKSTGKSYTLYSIGPDGKDDGGKSVPIGSKRPDMKIKGDFVVSK